MNSSWGSGLRLEKYSREYDSPAYMFAKTKDNLQLRKGQVYDEYVLWMYGYLVKYWVASKKASPKKVWNILPIDTFNDSFEFYYTQG